MREPEGLMIALDARNQERVPAGSMRMREPDGTNESVFESNQVLALGAIQEPQRGVKRTGRDPVSSWSALETGRGSDSSWNAPETGRDPES